MCLSDAAVLVRLYLKCARGLMDALRGKFWLSQEEVGVQATQTLAKNDIASLAEIDLERTATEGQPDRDQSWGRALGREGWDPF
jgi:hypothetical protein